MTDSPEHTAPCEALNGRWYTFMTGTLYATVAEAEACWPDRHLPDAIYWFEYQGGTVIAYGGQCRLPAEVCPCQRVWTRWRKEDGDNARR